MPRGHRGREASRHQMSQGNRKYVAWHMSAAAPSWAGGPGAFKGPVSDYGGKTFLERYSPRSAAMMPSAKQMQKGIGKMYKDGPQAVGKYMINILRQKRWKQMGYNPADWENPVESQLPPGLRPFNT